MIYFWKLQPHLFATLIASCCASVVSPHLFILNINRTAPAFRTGPPPGLESHKLAHVTQSHTHAEKNHTKIFTKLQWFVLPAETMCHKLWVKHKEPKHYDLLDQLLIGGFSPGLVRVKICFITFLSLETFWCLVSWTSAVSLCDASSPCTTTSLTWAQSPWNVWFHFPLVFLINKSNEDSSVSSLLKRSCIQRNGTTIFSCCTNVRLNLYYSSLWTLAASKHS